MQCGNKRLSPGEAVGRDRAAGQLLEVSATSRDKFDRERTVDWQKMRNERKRDSWMGQTTG